MRSIAKTLGLSFSRIQFTPDLMPSDITGTEIIEEDRATGKRVLEFVPGPVFTNLLLADEINRTPPKTQAALLEAMQERRVTIRGITHELDLRSSCWPPRTPSSWRGRTRFGAQLDRFMFNIHIGYLNEEEEIQVVLQTTGEGEEEVRQAVTGEEILRFQRLVRKVPASESVSRYAVRLVRSTRPGDELAPDFVRNWVSYGASLRASQYLILGGRARALMKGRYHVSYEDVRELALSVFRHRILINFHAESENVTPDQIVQRLLEGVPPPSSGL